MGFSRTWESNVSTASLPAGSYLDLNWTVNSPDAGNSPQTVEQSVTVDAHSVPVIWSYSIAELGERAGRGRPRTER